MKGAPEIRSELAGVHTTIGREKGFCALGTGGESTSVTHSKTMAHKQLVPENVPSWLLSKKPTFGPRPSVNKESDLWKNLLSAAIKAGHPDPEKMADTALRAREKSIALMAGRHKLLMTKEPPKPAETVAVAAAKKGRAVPAAGCRCKAMTLENRQCGFKATCGDFCKKHAPN